MKIVLDNIIFSNDLHGAGISNYWFELSAFLLKQASDEVFFYEERDAALNFHRKQLSIPENRLIANGKSSKSSIVRRLSPVDIALDGHFLFHSSYYRLPAKIENRVSVTTVHDFTHNYFASYLKRLVHNRIKYNSIRKANGIICISESTYKDLIKFCPPSKGQKVAIIHNGVSPDYFKLDRSAQHYHDYLHTIGIKTPFLLFVGSRVNYKNFSFVVQLLKQMPQLSLVVVGSQLSQQELKQFDGQMTGRMVNLSHVSNANLNILYNFAHAFVYPSSYEGFGIPIIEAMRAGCPALALRNSSITEIAGNAGILFDALDLDAFKNTINRLFETNYRNDIIGRGFEQSIPYSWERCCRETHDFYKDVY